MRDFIANFLIMLICSAAPLAWYALRKCGRANFVLLVWLKTNRDRFLVAAVANLVFTCVIFFVPQAAQVFAIAGMKVSEVTFGLVGGLVGALLVTAMGGRKKSGKRDCAN